MTNIAILGAGSIAHAMARTLRGMRAQEEEVCLYAVASRDLNRAKAFAEAEGFQKAYGSYDELVCDPAVELVYIATPHSHHAEHIRLCVEHGKAVLCEKSFTANAKQAEEVLKMAEDRGVLVTEAIWTRYMPSCEILQNFINKGAIGKPVLLTANLGYNITDKERIVKPELAGGALLDVGVYPINFAAMLFGTDIVRVESNCSKLPSGVDQTDNITLTYSDGRQALLSASCACRMDRRGMIYGTTGYLEVDNVNNPRTVTLYSDVDNYTHGTAYPVPEQITGYEYEVESCLEALANGRIECPEMPHAETLRIMRLMDQLRSDWGIRYPFE